MQSLDCVVFVHPHPNKSQHYIKLRIIPWIQTDYFTLDQKFSAYFTITMGHCMPVK